MKQKIHLLYRFADRNQHDLDAHSYQTNVRCQVLYYEALVGKIFIGPHHGPCKVAPFTIG